MMSLTSLRFGRGKVQARPLKRERHAGSSWAFERCKSPRILGGKYHRRAISYYWLCFSQVVECLSRSLIQNSAGT